MIGAIVGDIVGSRFEGSLFQREPIDLVNPLCEFTDDTVLTVAVAESLLRDHKPEQSFRAWWNKYPTRGYGEWFRTWARDELAEANPSNSNGAAMRASPIALLGTSQEQVMETARRYAAATHNTVEAKRGAEAIAVLTWFSARERDLSFLRVVCETDYYKLPSTVADYQEDQKFELRCDDTVPKAIVAVLEANCFEEAMINAVKIGGDVDTIACMAGGMAENLWGVPESLGDWAWEKLPNEMKAVLEELYRKAGREIAFNGIEKSATLSKPSLFERLKGALSS